ncbi:MAG: hypothetical protein II938_01830 [Alphaproteobacteria bacterium]|nr:hypothetical protein [Alphaproteobacteria bacterium]
MRKILFICVCSVALLSTTAVALRFEAPPVVDVKMRTLTKFLPAHNEALDKALEVHNLMTDLPVLQTMAEQQGKLKAEGKRMQKFLDNLLKCNEQRFSRFKNPKEVLKRVRAAYQEKTKNLKDEEGYYPEDSIMPRSIAERNALWDRKRDIEQEIMEDALTNGRKWGGEAINKNVRDVPENLEQKMVGTGLEELTLSENGVNNMKVAEMDFDNTFKQMQQDFIKRLAAVGLEFPDFDAARSGEINRVRKALKELRDELIKEAKEYIVKLNEQDAAHPHAVAKRAARTKGKSNVISEVREQFPEAFSNMDKLDQQTPQQRQQTVIAAMEKDANGTVYLTETNALEIEQRLVEQKANAAMVRTFQDQAENMAEEMRSRYPQQQDFDFSVCS